MRRPDVDRMMASISALQYKEWEAYERATGPLDSMWEREMIAELHELIQLNNALTGAAVTKKGKKNPAGKFRKVVRPSQLFEPPEGDDEDEDEDEVEDQEDDYDYEDEEEEAQELKSSNEYDPSKDPFAPPSERH